jgi:hypothetical protein
MRVRAAKDLVQLNDRDFFASVAEGLDLVIKNVNGLQRGAAALADLKMHWHARWEQRNALRSYYCLLKRLGLPRSGFHRLRHTFATQ